MRSSYPLPVIDEAACTACGECIAVCHVHALTLQGRHAAIAAPEACDYCGECEAVCPTGAISVRYEIVDVTPRGRSRP